MAADRGTAQTFTNLHSFTGSDANPESGLVLSSNTLYGTTDGSGAYLGGTGFGTVFSINTDGTGFTTLHTFTNGDGATPESGLIVSSNTLYGTTYSGGTRGGGTVFALNTDGTGFRTLYAFTGGTNGSGPVGSLVLSGRTLYGVSWNGGSSGYGTVFAVNADDTNFNTLHAFTAVEGNSGHGGLIMLSNTLYGTTFFGGTNHQGTVFAINSDGTGFTNLHTFNYSDGADSTARLILSGGTLYGTTVFGGSSDNGTVFKLNTDGTGFTNLYYFTPGSNDNNRDYITNSDGAKPFAGLVLSGNTLYGAASTGGSFADGTVFSVNTDGTGFTLLHTFAGGSDGTDPFRSGLVVSANTLYGTTFIGGSSGYGTVFRLSFNPQLTITLSDTNVILTWPTNFVGFDYTGYTLESTTNLVSPVWTTNSPAPVVVNGQNTVTNPIFGAQQFYRLSQ